MEKVILVNDLDEEIGQVDKMEAHEKAMLHRAFSVFLFNARGEMLLQQRALNKYHSAGLWTNACCSHPKPGEETLEAAQRRLHEELGIITPITKVFDFTYKAKFENGLTEHEFDHVFVGEYNSQVQPNSTEVKDFCYKTMNEIDDTLKSYPNKYTAWFQIAFPKIMNWWTQTRQH